MASRDDDGMSPAVAPEPSPFDRTVEYTDVRRHAGADTCVYRLSVVNRTLIVDLAEVRGVDVTVSVGCRHVTLTPEEAIELGRDLIVAGQERMNLRG